MGFLWISATKLYVNKHYIRKCFHEQKVLLIILIIGSLPRWLVVPSRALDWQLGEAGRHFNAGRPPLWCWSSPEGAALVRMADIIPTITDRYKYTE